jgi:hypothetical protein
VFNFNLDLTGKFPIIYIALGLIGVNILILNNHINIDNDYVLLVIYFFGFVAFFYCLLYFIFNILIPSYSYLVKNKFVNNFNYLSSKQQNIIWDIYFANNERKAKMQSNTDLFYLRRNRYIELIEKVSEKEAIYQINTKFISFLTKKLSQQIIENLKNLSDKEKKILDLFYDGNFKKKYNREDGEAMDLLIDKKIIEQKNDKFLVVSKYTKKILREYRKEDAKYSQIELGNHNIYIMPDTNAGGNGKPNKTY